MKTLTVISRTFAPHNLVNKLLNKDEVTSLQPVIEYFKMRCRSVVGYRQVNQVLKDMGIPASLVFESVITTSGVESLPTNQPVIVAGQEWNTQESVVIIPEVVIEEEVDNSDFLAMFLGGGTTQVESTPTEEVIVNEEPEAEQTNETKEVEMLKDVPESKRSLFQKMLDLGVPYEQVWRSLVSGYCPEASAQVRQQVLGTEEVPTTVSFKAAVMKLQTKITLAYDAVYPDNSRYDLQLPAGVHHHIHHYPRPKGQYKLSRVLRQAYNEIKPMLSEEDVQKFSDLLVAITEDFTRLCVMKYQSNSRNHFVQTKEVATVAALVTALTS